jgi:hypothetical protein
MTATGPTMPIESNGSTNRSACLNLTRMNGIRYLPIDVIVRGTTNLTSLWTLPPIDVTTGAAVAVTDLPLDGYYPIEVLSGAVPSLELEWRMNVVVVAAAALAEDSFFSYQSFEVDVTAGVSVSEPVLEDVLDLTLLGLKWIRVRRSISDAMWSFETSVFGATDPDLSSYKEIVITAQDKTGQTHVLFSGLAPDLKRQYAPVADETGIGGYGQEWYLYRQHPPSNLRIIAASALPHESIGALLAGTRIRARRLQPVEGWGSTVASDEVVSELGGKKAAAIDRFNALTDSLLFVLPDPDGSHEPIAYWVREDEIDDGFRGLDLPAPVAIRNPDPDLVGQVSEETVGADQYNRVIVRGLGPDGTFYEVSVESAEVTAGDPAVEYLEVDYRLTSEAACLARAQDLLAYFESDPVLYSCTFRDRVDLRLYQLLDFSDFTEIPDGRYRILSIEYELQPLGSYVHLEIAIDQGLKNQKRLLEMARPTGSSLASDVIASLMASVPQNKFGTVSAIVGSNCRVLLDQGDTITARLGGFCTIGGRVLVLTDVMGWVAVPVPTS